MKTKAGRNDPCPCGSGKKYKHCHLPLDEAAHRPEPAAAENVNAPNALADLEKTARVLEELQRTGSAKQQEEAGRILGRTTPLIAYLKREAEIHAAVQALEAHQEAFARYAEDAAAFQSGVESLFAEERFVPLRFTSEDIERAMEREGSLVGAERERFREQARKLVLTLAGPEYRTAAAAGLMAALPEYAGAGRWMDACVILASARATSKDAQAANPFLWQMFVHGYQAWTAAKTARLGA